MTEKYQFAPKTPVLPPIDILQTVTIPEITEEEAKKEFAFKKCSCDWCTKWSPIVHKVRNALDENTRIEFDELMDYYVNMEDDLGATQAKLDGDWPGWEFMKDVLKDRKWVR